MIDEIVISIINAIGDTAGETTSEFLADAASETVNETASETTGKYLKEGVSLVAENVAGGVGEVYISCNENQEDDDEKEAKPPL